jgi:hypothetical protein
MITYMDMENPECASVGREIEEEEGGAYGGESHLTVESQTKP